MSSTLVIVPTYNERENIPRLVEQVLAQQPPVHLLIIDDSSPDGTADLVRDLQRGEPRLHLVVRPRKAGLGTAYVEGFKKALQDGYQQVITMDGDLSHDPAYLPRMVEALGSVDVVVGSRYIPQGGTRNWNILRQALSRCGNLYARAVLRIPIRDCSAGFVGYRRRVLEAIPLDAIRSEGYSFLMEMKYWAYHLGFSMREVPIVFVERTKGRSKISRAILMEALWVVWRLRTTVPRTSRSLRGCG